MAARWTAAEDAFLAERYASGAPIRQIAAELRRTPGACTRRRKHLQLSPRSRRRPDERFDALLPAAVEANVPLTALAARLNVTVDELRKRRVELGLRSTKGPRYTEAEDEQLRQACAAGRTLSELAGELNRTPGALRARAIVIGALTVRAGGRRWSAAEDDVVRAGYAARLTCRDVAEQLPTRTAQAVSARASMLGLCSYGRRWTQAENRLLRNMAAKGATPAQAAQRLVRTTGSVRVRAAQLGLRLGAPAAGPRRRWTPEEDEVLRRWSGLDAGRLAAMLNRTDHAVRSRMTRLDLGRSRTPHHQVPSATGALTPGEWATLEREVRRSSRVSPRRIASLSIRLGRDEETLRRAVARLEQTAA